MIVTKATEEWLRCQRYPKMITFTIKHSDDPLNLQIKRIYDAFKKLKTRAFIKRRITGGIWFFQLKFNHTTEQWHPHIHCLVAGHFVPHHELMSLWKKITGDSKIVDIRPVKDLDGCANEVARYATSPADLTHVDLERALDVYHATKHRRICGSWGTARSVTLSPKPQEDDDTWFRVADFYYVNVKKQFDPNVRAFWKCYKQDKPWTGGALQPLKVLYSEEYDLIMSPASENMTYEQFRLRIMQDRNHNWKRFFEKEHGEGSNGGNTT